MRHHNRDESAINMMICAMASSLIEKHEALVTQECLHLREPDRAGRIAHLLKELGALTHTIPFGQEWLSRRGTFYSHHATISFPLQPRGQYIVSHRGSTPRSRYDEGTS
jgi:hypothetical protein